MKILTVSCEETVSFHIGTVIKTACKFGFSLVYLYLCSQNETDIDNSKDINGSFCRLSDGFAKLAEP